MHSEQIQADGRDSILIGTSVGDRAVPRHHAALARELVDRGYHVSLVTHGMIEDASFVDSRVAILKWSSARPTQLGDALFFDRLVRRLRPVCLISNFGSRNIMTLIGALRRVPVRIYWHHTLSSQVRLDWLKSKIRLRFLMYRARVVLRLSTHAVANSSAAKEDLVRNFGYPPSRCHVWPNSLEDPLAPGSIGSRQAVDSRRFVCVGRFSPSKGHDVLIRALKVVTERFPDARVLFIGDGAEQAKCVRLASELGVAAQCSFMGLLPHKEVLTHLASACATVVASRSEAFGLVNIESMAVSTPVIGSDTGGISEIVRDGVDGFLFPPGDHQALAERMIRLLENDTMREDMAQNARRRFLEHFEATRVVQVQAGWLLEQIRNATSRD